MNATSNTTVSSVDIATNSTKTIEIRFNNPDSGVVLVDNRYQAMVVIYN